VEVLELVEEKGVGRSSGGRMGGVVGWGDGGGRGEERVERL